MDFDSIPASMTRADYLKWAAAITPETFPEGRRVKVAILASFTVDFWKPYLVVEAARLGFCLEIWMAPFGQIEQQVLDPQSGLHQMNPDVVVILPRLEDLDPSLVWSHLRYSGDELRLSRVAMAARFEAVLGGIRSQSSARVMLGTFAPPAWSVAGCMDAMLELSQSGLIQRLNEDMAALCRQVADSCILDVAQIASEVGHRHWRDDRLAWLAKAPLSHAAMVALGRTAARRVRPWFVPAKKCLVLDMDDTIWGGILGEAGMEGVQMGQDYPGNVFTDFQRRVLALRDQGVLLAAASKNNAADVERVLTEHPACLLKREHFSAFEVHWEDKATSLRRIAETLNIGTDALVFFDDNPVEREWVRSQLPEVAVLDVPRSPMGYGEVLGSCGCFDSISVTAEDRQRAVQYQQGVQREELKKQHGTLEDYLRSLEMVLTVGTIDVATLPRVSQLLSKTNQFNLTTRRHSSAEIQRMLDEGAVGLWVRVEDRFGDNGIVGVVIAKRCQDQEQAWIIDTLLMSCRVIGRQIETAMLALVEQAVRERGGREMRGEFILTPKNLPAVDFFDRHGYKMNQTDSGLWRRTLDAPRALPDSLRICRA